MALGGLTVASAILGSSTTPKKTPTRVASTNRHHDRLLRASVAGGMTLIVTRWPVASLATGVLGWFASDLLGGKAARAHAVARTEAIASWAEMLRDTIGAAHGLEGAIAATADVAPEAIRPHASSLSAALQHQSLTDALRDFAEDLAHPIADMVVAALAVAANGSTRDLGELLSTLAQTARDEAGMQLRIEATRARIRTAVRVITACTLCTAGGLVLLNPSYVDVYSTSLGQVALALIAICWGMALWWLARMSQFHGPQRFLLTVNDRGALPQ